MKREIASVREHVVSAVNQLTTLAFKGRVFGDEIKPEDIDEVVSRDLTEALRQLEYLESLVP